MYDEAAAPARRDADHSAATRLTGLTGQQLVVQFIGGLLLAAVVGGLSAWATQQVMSEQLTALSRQLDEVRTDLRQMRQDLYAPRLRGSNLPALWELRPRGESSRAWPAPNRQEILDSCPGLARLPPGRP